MLLFVQLKNKILPPFATLLLFYFTTMSSNHLRDLTNAWQTIIMFGLLGLVLSLVISFVQPLRYASTARLLILQNIGIQVDAYTASRSEERVAENLSTIIYTSTFFDQVMDSGFDMGNLRWHS